MDKTLNELLVPNSKKSKKEIQEKNSYTEKYNQYVTLSNKIHDVNKQITSYFQDAGENEKLSRNEVPGSGFSLFTPDILPNLKNTIAKTPKIEGLDEKAQRLLTALEKMKPLADQIQYYYFNDKKYLDDNYKQGKEIHKQISAVYPEYKKSLEDFEGVKASISDYGNDEFDFEFIKVKGTPIFIQNNAWFWENIDESYSFFLSINEEGYIDGLGNLLFSSNILKSLAIQIDNILSSFSG